ncbi:MAG TPA: TIGR02757 family protein [Desulfomonilia bacterium]
MPGCSPPSKEFFEGLYRAYNHYEYIHPDPLEFVYRYPEGPDREVVGLIVSCLAYGRVAQILKSAGTVLDTMGKSPRLFIERSNGKTLQETFSSFKHRFTNGRETAFLIEGIRNVISSHGSIEACIASNIKSDDTTILPALEKMVERLSGDYEFKSLLPRPSAKSACKRLNLFLKWMIRKDNVDPGCWKSISPRLLVMPIDTHIFRVCSNLGITNRKSADIKTALEITGFFREMNPDDPVKYDFALTRPGIWNGRIPDKCREKLHQEAVYG